MTDTEFPSALERALAVDSPSARLQAALTAGSAPDPAFVDVLIARCAIEPDFYVRDMLTWALTRHDTALVLASLLPELHSDTPQARSQALHTLTKIADPSSWAAISPALLRDHDDQVARTAWRAAAGLVPVGHEPELAGLLATQLGRGDRDVQRSLSRAFAQLGPAASVVIETATTHDDEAVRSHALATARLIADPDEDFDAAITEARRTVALRAAPQVGG
ncbi:HEAT repeat domain-containing protein [Microbacterium sp. NPDC056234]|uniref:HEAT repeat domain-containing protein n=1 Tax=Microbacterium sp. NPDC056234 TaxID=3345757 RepID=UPI0035DA7CA5